MKNAKKIGRRIRQFREESGLSQQELAEKLDISFQQLQKYEYGQSSITVERLIQLSQVLHVPMVKLIPSPEEDADLHSTGDEASVYSPYERVIVNPEEVLVLKYYRRLRSEKLRNLLLKHIKEWVEIQKELERQF